MHEGQKGVSLWISLFWRTWTLGTRKQR